MIAALLLALAAQAPGPRIAVAVERVDGEVLCTLEAESAPLDLLLARLAEELDVEVEGIEGARRATLVSARLERRPLAEVLEVVLGSVGLRHRMRSGTLSIVVPETEADPRALLERADAAWLSVLATRPDHELAAHARFAQAELAERLGRPEAALEHLRAIPATYPRSELVPEARRRAGLLLQRLGRWSEALIEFRELADLQGAPEQRASSRLEMARCSVELGDAQSAWHLLEALDAGYPAADGLERARRDAVRAHALVALGRPREALALLARADVELPRDEREATLQVRALALEQAGESGEASRAWLLHAHSLSGEARELALERAGRLALEAGDEIGALFVCKEAERLGCGSRLAPLRDQARARLGFAVAGPSLPKGAEERVAEAERRLDEARYAEALRALEPLVPSRGALASDVRVRLAAARARALAGAQGVDAALAWLREERRALAAPDAEATRAALDVAAAAVLEERGLYDRAVDAYAGAY